MVSEYKKRISDSVPSAVQDDVTQRIKYVGKDSLGFLSDDVLFMIFDQLMTEDASHQSRERELLIIMKCTDRISKNKRRFHELGERALYKSVSLQPQKLVFFHRSILARSQLASYVQSIELFDFDRELPPQLGQKRIVRYICGEYHVVPALKWIESAVQTIGKLSNIKNLQLKCCNGYCNTFNIGSYCEKILNQEALQTLKHLSFSPGCQPSPFHFKLLRFLPQKTRLQSLSGCNMFHRNGIQAKPNLATITTLRMRESDLTAYSVKCFSVSFPQLDTFEFEHNVLFPRFTFVWNCLAPLKTRLRSLTLHLLPRVSQIGRGTRIDGLFSKGPWNQFSSLEYLSVSAKLLSAGMETLALELPSSLKRLQVVHCSSIPELEGLLLFLKTLDSQKKPFPSLQEFGVTVAPNHDSSVRELAEIRRSKHQLHKLRIDQVGQSLEGWEQKSQTTELINLSDLCDTMNIKFRYGYYTIEPSPPISPNFRYRWMRIWDEE